MRMATQGTICLKIYGWFVVIVICNFQRTRVATPGVGGRLEGRGTRKAKVIEMQGWLNW